MMNLMVWAGSVKIVRGSKNEEIITANRLWWAYMLDGRSATFGLRADDVTTSYRKSRGSPEEPKTIDPRFPIVSTCVRNLNDPMWASATNFPHRNPSYRGKKGIQTIRGRLT